MWDEDEGAEGEDEHEESFLQAISHREEFVATKASQGYTEDMQNKHTRTLWGQEKNGTEV